MSCPWPPSRWVDPGPIIPAIYKNGDKDFVATTMYCKDLKCQSIQTCGEIVIDDGGGGGGEEVTTTTDRRFITYAPTDPELPASRTLAVTSGHLDLTIGGNPGDSATLGLPTVNLIPGTFTVATVTVDSQGRVTQDRKSTRLNSSHHGISYA